MTSELLPCPFCSGENLEFYYADIEGWIAHVRCKDCDDMIGPMSEFKYPTQDEAAEDATAKWNRRSQPSGEPMQWHDGEPPKHIREEWFIAALVGGGRVVLRALPENWTYDYTTQDDTFYKADRIKNWMQFPDSEFVPYNQPEGK